MHPSTMPSNAAFHKLLIEILDFGEDSSGASRERLLCEACRLLAAEVLYTVIQREAEWVRTGFGPQRPLGSQRIAQVSGITRHVLSKRARFLDVRLPLHGPFNRHQDGWAGIEVASYVAVPIHRRGRIRGVLVLLRSAAKPPFDVSDLGHVDLLAEALAVGENVADRIAGLEELAQTDSLTRLPNQRHFRQALARAVLRAEETGQALTLLVVEADLRPISALRGAIAAPEILPRIARVLERNLRGTDLVAHHGGSTFVILLPETTKEDSAFVRDRLERAMLPATLGPGARERATLRWGRATYPADGLDASALLSKAGRDLSILTGLPAESGSIPGEEDGEGLMERSA